MSAKAAACFEQMPDSVRTDFGHRTVRLRHRLANHPLFDLEQLVALSQTLPPERIEFNAGNLPINQDPDSVPHTGLNVRDTIEQIAHCGSWMVLKHIQHQPEYATLLNAALDEVSVAIAPQPLFSRVGFIFISSPDAVTPYHIDPENNILLQIRGSKVMSLFDPNDRSLVGHEALEAFYTRGHRNLNLSDAQLAGAREYALAPGDAIHVPQHAPHFVRNGAEVSVSFSITCHTPGSDRCQGIYWANRQLRRTGLQPSPPGSGADTAKYGVYRALRGIKRRLAR